MEFKELNDKVLAWASDRNIIEGSTPRAQFLKSVSEIGELADGINKDRLNEVKDGIGDVVVTLIILAAQYRTTIDECLAIAYESIKDRKGLMVDGVFIKEGDEA